MTKKTTNKRIQQTLSALLFVCFLTACDEQSTTKPTESNSTLPPGFTDAPPPPPTSDTYILSGGNLLKSKPIEDSVVVIRDGVILGFGARGQVDVPNDSIGIDVRGKWLVPTAGTLQQGTAANLRILNHAPHSGTAADVHGVVEDGELSLLGATSD